MIVFANGGLTVSDAPMAGIAPYQLKVVTSANVCEVLGAEDVRELRDALSDWLERCGR